MPSICSIARIALVSLFPEIVVAQVSYEPDYVWIRGGPGRSLSSAVAPRDGSFLMTADGDVLARWRPSDGALLRTIASPPGQGPRDLAITPDGALLAAGTGNLGGSIVVWDVLNEEILQIIPVGPSRYLGPVAISPDGRLVAATVSDVDAGPDLMLWRVSDRQLLGSWDWLGYGTVLAFSPDGRFLVVANLSGFEDAYYRLRMINLESGNL